MSKSTYIPAPHDATEMNKRLAKVGGTAPNGKPRFKAVWGMDETEYCGGKQVIKYFSTDPLERGMPRWIVEQWYPPSLFDKETWEEFRYENGVDLMGKFPSNGFYGMAFAVVDNEGGFCPLDENVVRFVQESLRERDNPHMTADRLKKIKQKKEELRLEKEQELDNWVDDEFDRMFTKDGWMKDRKASLPVIAPANSGLIVNVNGHPITSNQKG